MARSDLFQAAQNAQKVYKLIKNISEDEGLEGWVQEKIIKANDYLNTIREYLEHKTLQKRSLGEQAQVQYYNVLVYTEDGEIYVDVLANNNEEAHQQAMYIVKNKYHEEPITTDLKHPNGPPFQTNEQGGGVIAGGMSNFEESTKKVDSLVTDALKIMKSPEMQDAVKALKTVLGHREYNSRPRFYQFYVKQLMDMYDKQGMTESKCPKCGGPSYSKESIAEAKDACYHKVKSRYKVWPSAYASGALVKCRKKGAKNWGSKSK